MPLDRNRQMDGSFKVSGHVSPAHELDVNNEPILTDIVLALTPTVDETVPWQMYFRESFIESRRLLLIQWLIMANVISHVYKGALLTSLINIRYPKPLDTMIQMEESGIPFYCLGNTVLCWLAKTDPRPVGLKLNERRFDMPFSGGVEEKYLEE